jgi:hypothetical protein
MGAWDDDTSTQGMQSAIDAQTGITAQKTLADAGAASRAATPAKPAPNTLMHWMVDLPQNVSTGLLDTAVNTADAMHSAWQWGNDGQRQAMAKVSATDTSGYSPEQLQHYNAGRQGMGQPDTVDPMTEPGLMSARMGVNQEAYDAGNKERVANASAPSAVSPIYDHARDATGTGAIRYPVSWLQQGAGWRSWRREHGCGRRHHGRDRGDGAPVTLRRHTAIRAALGRQVRGCASDSRR